MWLTFSLFHVSQKGEERWHEEERRLKATWVEVSHHIEGLYSESFIVRKPELRSQIRLAAQCKKRGGAICAEPKHHQKRESSSWWRPDGLFFNRLFVFLPTRQQAASWAQPGNVERVSQVVWSWSANFFQLDPTSSPHCLLRDPQHRWGVYEIGNHCLKI